LQGIQGLTGATGSQGIQGIQGIQGLKGEWGTNGTDGLNLTFLSITNLLNGSYMWNFSDGTSYITGNLSGMNGMNGLNGTLNLTGLVINTGGNMSNFNLDAGFLFFVIVISLWIYFVTQYFDKKEFIFCELQFGLAMPLTIALAVFSFNYTLGFVLVMLIPIFSIWILIDGVLYRKKEKQKR
jgi:hypothetical protein